mgnify:CR=1 FL=1
MAAMNLNHEEFNRFQNEGKLMLVDYWAPWCGYCRRIGPAYDKVAQQYSKDMVVAKVNIDEEALLADSQQIEVIPTLIIYKDGQALGSIVAPESKARIEQFIQETLGI